jgi:flagellar motor protein MotB
MSDNRDDQIALEAYRVAKEARNLEITLFWQRSNYFLVLSTAVAVGFFSLREPRYALPLALFGLAVALLWVAVNLGSKFWQNRWENRLRVTEEQLRPGMDLFSASWHTVQEDVRQSFEFRRRGAIHRIYTRLVLLKPSVSFMMTLLSLTFVGFWIMMFFVLQQGSQVNSHPQPSMTSDGQIVMLSIGQSNPTPTPLTIPSASPPESDRSELLISPFSYRWALFGLVMIFLLGFGFFIYGLKSGQTWAKVGGAITMTASLLGSSSFTLLKIGKIENTFKGSVDRLFELKVSKGGFSPGQIIRLEGFCSSHADLRREIADQIRESCDTRNLKDSHAFLLVVGATDNKPLSGGPFESNFGLARARAERVRDILLGQKCNMPEHNVLALVSGPRHTGTQHDSPQFPKDGTAEDRSVDVWAFWDKPTASESKLGKFELLTSVGAMGSQQSCASSVTAPIHRKKNKPVFK